MPLIMAIPRLVLAADELICAPPKPPPSPQAPYRLPSAAHAVGQTSLPCALRRLVTVDRSQLTPVMTLLCGYGGAAVAASATELTVEHRYNIKLSRPFVRLNFIVYTSSSKQLSHQDV
jgi:hypothetical protein